MTTEHKKQTQKPKQRSKLKKKSQIENVTVMKERSNVYIRNA